MYLDITTEKWRLLETAGNVASRGKATHR